MTKNISTSMNKRVSRLLASTMIPVAVLAILFALLPWYSNHLRIQALESAQKGEPADSLHTAERAVTVNPVSLQARFVLAGAQQRLGRDAEARNTLVKALDLQPLNYNTWEQLAIYERDQWGEADLSQEHFAIAIRLNPEDEQLRIRAKETAKTVREPSGPG
jgi:tetratricopeptide (TPR) repeat protein